MDTEPTAEPQGHGAEAAAADLAAYRQGLVHDAALIERHGLRDENWAARQAAAIEAVREQRR